MFFTRILTMTLTGIRAIEMARITYRDLEPYTTDDGTHQYRIFITGKGKKERYIYIDRIEIDEELDLLKKHFSDDSLIAITRNNKPLGPVQINHAVSQFAKEL